MSEKKKNIPLIVALSIPVLMIVLIALTIYVPSFFVKPTIDFVYSTGGNYCSQKTYFVEHKKVTVQEKENLNQNKSCSNDRKIRLFYYDVQDNNTREITFEEAQTFNLDSHFESVNGFQVVSGHSGYSFFYTGGSSYYKKYLKKGAFSQELKIGRQEHRYTYNFTFLGWVNPVE